MGRKGDKRAPQWGNWYCVPHFPREISTATEDDYTIVKLTNLTVTATSITGTYTIPKFVYTGEYAVKVFIGDKARTSPDTTEITTP